MENNIEENIIKLIERYSLKNSPEGVIVKVRNTGYSYRLDYYIQMDDLISGRLDKIDSDEKIHEFNDSLSDLINQLFSVNIMAYGFRIIVDGEQEWINSVFNKQIKQSFKQIEGSNCIASIKIIRDAGELEYDIVFGLKQNCKPTMCTWDECEKREKNLQKLGNKLRTTLNTFNFPEGLFTIKLSGRDIRSKYIF